MTEIPLDYVRATLGPREPVLDEILRSSLLVHRLPTIQIDDNAARLLQVLTMLRQPRHALEIGTLFGYSTIHLARGLPEGGRLTTVEVDSRAAEVARENLDCAGVADRVEVVVADAGEYLATVAPESMGLVFIDGDKRSYLHYLKLCFPLLEPGALLIADDAYAMGDFSGEHSASGGDIEAQTIRAYAVAVGRSPHLYSCFAGTQSGLLISVRR